MLINLNAHPVSFLSPVAGEVIEYAKAAKPLRLVAKPVEGDAPKAEPWVETVTGMLVHPILDVTSNEAVMELQGELPEPREGVILVTNLVTLTWLKKNGLHRPDIFAMDSQTAVKSTQEDVDTGKARAVGHVLYCTALAQ